MKTSKEEKAILDSVGKGEWKSVRGAKGKMNKYQEYAKATFRKDKRVNIRISEKDLVGIQKKAVEEGLPYQTLISSVLHKFISGRLTEKKNDITIKCIGMPTSGDELGCDCFKICTLV